MFVFRPSIALGVLVATCLPGPTTLVAQVESVVRVEVREAGSDHPLAEVVVEVVGGVAAPVRTGADGRAVLRGLPPGRHTLRARGPGYAPADRIVDAENGLRVDVVFRLQPRPLVLDGLRVEVAGLPAGARAISEEEIGPADRTLGDVVERLPGVTVVRRGGPGTAATPSIRGSSGDQVLVLVDGVTLNSPLTGEADLSEVDLAAVVRVTVVPGVRAARYGPGALAGAILIETRRPATSTARARVETGSLASWALGGSASLARAGSPWRWSLGGEWSRTDGDFEYPVPDVRGGGVARRDNADVRGASGFAEAAREPGSGPRLRMRLHAREVERGSPGTVVQPSLTGRNEERRIGLLLQGDGGGATRSWAATLGADRIDAVFDDPDPPLGEAYRSDSEVRQLDARAEGRLGLGAVELGTGLDGRLQAVESTSVTDDAPGTVAGVGAWLRGRWHAGDPDRSIEVTGTLRADVHDLLDGVVASPSLSVVRGRHGTSLEAALGNAVSPPDLSDLFFQEGVLARANPDLAPERIRGEVGVELRQSFRSDAWSGTVGLGAFRADVDGMILWFPDHRFVWSPRNVDVHRRGIEATGELRAGPLDPLQASVGWTRVEYANAALDGQVVYRPELTADVSARVPTGRLDWTVRWRWVGARRTSPGTELNELPGYGRLDTGLRLPLRLRGVAGAFELAVDNVLDETASLLVDYPLPGRTLTLRIRAGPAGT
ncbi:MAG TPA: TonB-dependent receptor [Longimicrobiales bacterium]|nr:TonB-dependent receptor [Longimicrobiales bacterium]